MQCMIRELPRETRYEPKSSSHVTLTTSDSPCSVNPSPPHMWHYQWLTLLCQPKSSLHVTPTTSDSPCTVNSVRRSGSSAFSLFSMSIVLKARRPVYRHSWYHWETGWKWTCWFHWDTRCIRTWSQCVPHLCGKWSVYCKVPPQYLYWGTDKIHGILWTSEGFVLRGHGLYFGFNPTISKGFQENWSALLGTVYCKTVSSCVRKSLRKPGSGLWINENCLGRGRGLFQIAI
jgi:hypothetical protein